MSMKTRVRWRPLEVAERVVLIDLPIRFSGRVLRVLRYERGEGRPLNLCELADLVQSALDAKLSTLRGLECGA